MNRLHQILVKPLDTEKGFSKQKEGKFAFQVKADASKTEVKDAVEKYYGVKVKGVTTSKIKPKTRRAGRGREVAKRSLSKKAIVTTVGAKPIEINKVKI